MAITPKAAALAVLLGGTVAAGSGWAQTAAPATPPAADAAAAATEAPAAAEATSTTEAPAADAPAAGAQATEVPAPEAPAAGAPAADAQATGTATAETPPAGEAAGTASEGAAAPATGDAAAAPADAAPAADAPAAAAQGAAPAAAAGPAASREAASVGQYYVDATHGDWTLRCIKAPEGTDPCELYQLLKDAKGNSVSEVSIIPLQGEAAAGATVVAPLETDLVAGLGLKVDSGRQLGYPFNFCAPVGCVARIGFTTAELDAMKRGNTATVSLLPYGVEAERRVDLNLSLKGFTAGFDAVAAKMPAPEAKTE